MIKFLLMCGFLSDGLMHILRPRRSGPKKKNTIHSPWLSLSILVPIVGALLVPLVPDKGEGRQVRWYALIVTLITEAAKKLRAAESKSPSICALQ